MSASEKASGLVFRKGDSLVKIFA